MKEVVTEMDLLGFKYRYEKVLQNEQELKKYEMFILDKYPQELKLWLREEIGGSRGAHGLQIKKGVYGFTNL